MCVCVCEFLCLSQIAGIVPQRCCCWNLRRPGSGQMDGEEGSGAAF